MTFLKFFSAFFFICLALYTAVVVSNDGANFLAVFLGELFTVNWNGQFILDFSGYLILSGLWVAWRHGFSGAGIALGLLAATAGMMFFAPYVFFAVHKAQGDVHAFMSGQNSTP